MVQEVDVAVGQPRLRFGRWGGLGLGLVLVLSLAACGGGHDAAAPEAASVDAGRQRALAAPGSSASPGDVAVQLSLEDAVRLAQQATFGPNEKLIQEIQRQGPVAWLQAQVAATGSRYSLGGDDSIHTNTLNLGFCETPKQVGNPYCWRDYYSSEPLVWDFYRNALHQPDQLRQRVALALQQIHVVSAVEIGGTYGLRAYQNGLLNRAFDNYREVLRHVILSPVMGDYLDHVNNDRSLPNENFARELLQLFSVGPCRINGDGQLAGGKCRPTYDNRIVRNYAYALTGWTYPKGGKSYWGCWPEKSNCLYYGGPMEAVSALHDNKSRDLLSGVIVPQGSSPTAALELVIDSLMQHENLAPFVAKRLIQHLVMGDPSPDYVKRVVEVFKLGRYTASNGAVFGKGRRGDLAATVAAILLDDAARRPPNSTRREGHLRAPVLLFTGTLRALEGDTDGAPFTWYWGETLRQNMFRPPSVFSFYPSDYPVAGTTRIGPEFGIHNSNTALNRLNFLTYLFDWGGSNPDPNIPGAVGTRVNLAAFTADAGDAEVLVDRLSKIVLGRPLGATPRAKVINAVQYWKSDTASSDWRLRRVRTAAYLVLASPDYQVQP